MTGGGSRPAYGMTGGGGRPAYGMEQRHARTTAVEIPEPAMIAERLCRPPESGEAVAP